MMSVSTHRRAAFWLFVVALVFFAADAAYADVLTDIGKGYQTESVKWFPKLLVIAKSLFWKLAAIEFAWASILWVLKNQEMQSFTAAVVQKLIGIGFFYALLQNADYWIPAIVNSLAKSGNEATGLPALTPSEVFDLGIDTAVTMLDGIQKLSLWDDFATIVIAGLSALAIVISFLIIAGQMLIALIESYIAISGGVLFLGFGGSRWTVEFTQKYISYAFATGIKLFMLYLIIGVGTSQAKTWGALLATTDWNNIFTVMGGSILLAFLAFQIPNMAASMLSGAPSLTAGAAAATAGTLAAGTVAAGAGALSPAMQSAKGGMQALKAGYDHHRGDGGGVLSSALKAIGTSTVDMGREAGRSAGESMGLAKPSESQRSSVGGRAAEQRDGMTAQRREERAAMNEAGGPKPGTAAEKAAEGDSANGDSAGNKSTAAAPVVPPPGGKSSVVDDVGNAASKGGSSQVVDDFGNLVQPPAAKISESNAGGAGTSAANSSAMNASSGNRPAPAVGSAAPALGAGQSGQFAGREKTPFQDLQRVKPPQIPNDAAPQAGVNIRLSHSED